jgi:PAS domain S-box-containing protein
MLDEAPCGFVSFGDDGRIRYVNTTLARRLGFSRDDLVGKPIEQILTVGSRIFYQTHLFPLVKLHGRAQEVFVLFRAGSGEEVAMLVNAERRERGAAGAVTECVLMEVRERRKFEEALVNARQAADRANVALAEATKAKSTFLAVMSHELRTPLNAISGYVQLLEMEVHGPVTAPQREALGRIQRSQRHLLRLINDVLNLAKIEAGRVDYQIKPVELTTVVKSVLPMVEPQMNQKGLGLEQVLVPEVVASADREKVEQILLNLLTNAVKFTPAGGMLRIETGLREPERVFARVIDTGIGIPADMIGRVFEPFIQVNTTHTKATEGTGLGLAISRDLARGMGGDLTATSTPGKGSTFELTLPKEVSSRRAD